MITRCANPACQQELHYLRNGRIIAVDIPAGDAKRVEHFWLCGSCCQFLDFDCMQDGSMQLRSKPGHHSTAAEPIRKPPMADLPPAARMRR
jgi:hypothetical protein